MILDIAYCCMSLPRYVGCLSAAVLVLCSKHLWLPLQVFKFMLANNYISTCVEEPCHMRPIHSLLYVQFVPFLMYVAIINQSTILDNNFRFSLVSRVAS